MDNPNLSNSLLISSKRNNIKLVFQIVIILTLFWFLYFLKQKFNYNAWLQFGIPLVMFPAFNMIWDTIKTLTQIKITSETLLVKKIFKTNVYPLYDILGYDERCRGAFHHEINRFYIELDKGKVFSFNSIDCKNYSEVTRILKSKLKPKHLKKAGRFETILSILNLLFLAYIVIYLKFIV